MTNKARFLRKRILIKNNKAEGNLRKVEDYLAMIRAVQEKYWL